MITLYLFLREYYTNPYFLKNDFIGKERMVG